MKEWKIVIGSPGKIIVGDIKIESAMVDARTLSILNRKVSSRSGNEELNLTGFIKLFNVTVSNHNNREYQEFAKYEEILLRKSDIYFVYDENQPKSVLIDESSSNQGEADLIQKKAHWFEITTRKQGNSFFVIRGLFTGFLKHFEDNDFIQLSNVSVEEHYKKEEGIFKLKYDRKSYVSINTAVIETVAKSGPPV